MKKLILYTTILILTNNNYTQQIENQNLPQAPCHTVIDSSTKDKKSQQEIPSEDEDPEQKDPHNFEDIIECLTNPSSKCKNILFNPNDTDVYAKTHYNLRTQPRLTIAKVCGNDPKVNKALKQYHELLTAERKFSGKSLYDQTFRQYIKQKERLVDFCSTITRWAKNVSDEWNDKTLEDKYKKMYVILFERRMLSGKAERRYLSQEYKPFLSDLTSVIEKKETAEIFTKFEPYHTHTSRNPHDVFDVINCIINPQKNCNTILFSTDGDFSRSEYNIRCEAKKTIANYIRNPNNDTNINNGKKRLIKKSHIYWKRKPTEILIKVHNICQNIATSYCPPCDDKTQEIRYNELNRDGIKRNQFIYDHECR